MILIKMGKLYIKINYVKKIKLRNIFKKVNFKVKQGQLRSQILEKNQKVSNLVLYQN